MQQCNDYRDGLNRDDPHNPREPTVKEIVFDLNKELFLEELHAKRLGQTNDIIVKFTEADNMKFIHRLYYDQEDSRKEYTEEAR